MSRVNREGSEYYTWIPGTVAAGAYEYIELHTQFPRLRKYLPANFVEVSNNDVVNLTIFLNGNVESLPCPAGTIRVIRKSVPCIWQLAIRNDDAVSAITANAVIVTVRREPKTADDLAREEY